MSAAIKCDHCKGFTTNIYIGNIKIWTTLPAYDGSAKRPMLVDITLRAKNNPQPDLCMACGPRLIGQALLTLQEQHEYGIEIKERKPDAS